MSVAAAIDAPEPGLEPEVAEALAIVAHLWGVREIDIMAKPWRAGSHARHGSVRTQEARGAFYFVLMRMRKHPVEIAKIVGKHRSTIIQVTGRLSNRKRSNPHLFERLREACSVMDVLVPLPPPCILFVGFITEHRLGDFLPESRKGTDLCQRVGCCRHRADHLAWQYDMKHPRKETGRGRKTRKPTGNQTEGHDLPALTEPTERLQG